MLTRVDEIKLKISKLLGRQSGFIGHGPACSPPVGRYPLPAQASKASFSHPKGGS